MVSSYYDCPSNNNVFITISSVLYHIKYYSSILWYRQPFDWFDVNSLHAIVFHLLCANHFLLLWSTSWWIKSSKILSFWSNFLQTLYKTAVFGSIGLATTSWLKYFAVVTHNFALILVMQSFCAMSHIFLSAVPSKLSAWFPKNEECFISGVNIFCNNIGMVLNFISLMAINSANDLIKMSRDLRNFMFIVAVFSTILALLIAISFLQLEAPKFPPSYYEALRRDKIIQSESKSFLKALRILLTNKNFVMLFVGLSLQLGIFNGFTTLINSIIIYYFPVSEILLKIFSSSDYSRLRVVKCKLELFASSFLF